MPPINYPAEPRVVLKTALDWLQVNKRIALITLVNIEGSAPYPLGSQMVVDHQGNYRGQITGGCAESALAQQAVASIDNGINATQRYGLNSPFFDIQLPCGSGIDVVIDVLTEETEYESMQAQLAARKTVQQSIATEHGTFTKQYLPTERLCLFGQGPILLKLAQAGLQSGFEVIIFAQDEVTEEMLAEHSIKAQLLDATQPDLTNCCDAFTAVVSLFHEHSYEAAILNAALNTEAFYIGALGSKKTHAARCQALIDNGRDKDEIERIFGPVGLDIGAQSPAQIAVSILAQIIEKLPGKDR